MAKILPIGRVVPQELAQGQLGIVQLEPPGLEEHAGIEIVRPQPREEEVGVLRSRDDHNSVAAPQARPQVDRDGIGEVLRVAV